MEGNHLFRPIVWEGSASITIRIKQEQICCPVTSIGKDGEGLRNNAKNPSNFALFSVKKELFLDLITKSLIFCVTISLNGKGDRNAGSCHFLSTFQVKVIGESRVPCWTLLSTKVFLGSTTSHPEPSVERSALCRSPF